MEKNDLRLLVVDDEEAARYGIRRALEAFAQPIRKPRVPKRRAR